MINLDEFAEIAGKKGFNALQKPFALDARAIKSAEDCFDAFLNQKTYLKKEHDLEDGILLVNVSNGIYINGNSAEFYAGSLMLVSGESEAEALILTTYDDGQEENDCINGYAALAFGSMAFFSRFPDQRRSNADKDIVLVTGSSLDYLLSSYTPITAAIAFPNLIREHFIRSLAGITLADKKDFSKENAKLGYDSIQLASVLGHILFTAIYVKYLEKIRMN